MSSPNGVTFGFEAAPVKILIVDIAPLRVLSEKVRKSRKYAQVRASIENSGLAELPVVARDHGDRKKFLLLDGHVRLAILQELGFSDVTCLVAKDDEAYTYNKRINRIATVQEHQMILNAIQSGVPEDIIAANLDVDIASIRQKRRLLTGICPEVKELLGDRHVPLNCFNELKKMKPLRQIEAAQLMLAMNKFSIAYARSLVGATPPTQLTDAARARSEAGLTDAQAELMQRESASLNREFLLLEETYGSDHLELVIATGYVKRLLENVRVVRFLAEHHPELLMEFQKVVESPRGSL